MGWPENGVYIIQGEVNLVVTAMRRNTRWTSHSHQDDEQDPLLSSFSQLKEILNSVSDLQELAPNEFLSPFLEVIRSEDTTGPITGLALTSVNKFLSYGLIDANSATAGAAIQNIADAVTHARFVGTDPSNDEVVLMKILHVLRTLLLTPAGAMLTNEAVCEIMQSCFRICFEMRLSELLRKSAEHTLMDMVQLLFCRLPHFKEDPKWATSLKKLKMRTGGMEQTRGGRFRKRSPKPKQRKNLKNQGQPAIILSQPEVIHHSQPQSADTDFQSQPIHEQDMNSDLTQSQNINSVQEQDVTSDLGAEAGVSAAKDTECVESSTGSAQLPDSLSTCAESNVSSSVDYAIQDSVTTTIATTPCDINHTVIDIQKGFKDASESEPNAHHVSIGITDGDQTTESMGLGPYLGVPKDEDLTRSSSEQDLDMAMDHVSMDQMGMDHMDRVGIDRVGMPHELTDDGELIHSAIDTSDGASVPDNAEYVNPRGVRFMPHHQHGREGTGPLIPYGLPCVRELFRFLVSLTNPMDRHNTDIMVHMGLSLLTAALESGADNISTFSSLTCLVKDDLCKNLFFLLQSDRLSLFAASIRVCFLLFESMRNKLKFQMEMYFMKLMDVIVSDSPRISYEQREVALESIVQLLRIPGLVTELYLNYDCDLYCNNLFEDLMKMLSKNAFPVSGLFTTHLLSLDALLAVIDSIEQHCHHRVLHTAKKLPDGGSAECTTTEGKPDDGSGSVESDEVSASPTPPPSGYSVADKMKTTQETETDGSKQTSNDVRSGPRIRPNRMKVSTDIPTEEELAAIKHKKKLYHTGSEQFNMKPSKGIVFLQSHGLLSDPLDAGEIVTFLKENPKLDKKQIGEYISDRKYSIILEAFQKSFYFDDVRIDEALRMYLESFRLPGEAPVIARLLEHFADHWHKMNGEPLANTDAAFTLAYAVLMLNTDQHNTNAKKQNVPMNVEDFKRNLRKVNGGKDFDEEMLEEVFVAIKSDEIVMPSEQYGLVRENYLWKTLIRRGNYKEGIFTHVPTGAFDRDLFSIVWGPTVAALSFVFDKSLDEMIIQKAVSGFRKCAMISAHYGISDVFDNLVISLCKFTTLLSSAEELRAKGRLTGSAEVVPISFGNNNKAQLAARTVFGLAHRHGDILREGWKNIIDCMLQLYRAKLLPDLLVKVEDFIDPSGKISLIREEASTNQRSESGVLSSFYSYFTLTEPTPQRGQSTEEQEASKRAHKCITECHVELLIQESKFLRVDSLQELLKALIFASQCPDANDALNGLSRCDEDSAVFFLELLIKVVLQNRDRISPFWQSIRDHIYNLIVNATEPSFLVERAVVGLLRLAIRLLRREEIASQVLASMRIILMMKPTVIHAVSRQVAYGLHDLLKTNAANIHSMEDWFTLFTLLEVVGAGTNPPPIMQVGVDSNAVQSELESGAQSDSELTQGSSDGMDRSAERGYTSDSELYESASRHGSKTNAASATGNRANINGDLEIKPLPDSHGSWMLPIDPVDSKPENAHYQVYNKHHHDKQPNTTEDSEDGSRQLPKRNQFSINLSGALTYHDPKSLAKCCETLAFLVRDAAHVTPHNFETCVHTIRTFVEGSLNGGHPIKTPHKHSPSNEKKKTFRKKKGDNNMSRSRSSPSHLTQFNDSDDDKETDGYHTLSIQLLDLMHTLHTRAATIFSSWAEEERSHQVELADSAGDVTGIDAGTSTLWMKCWCPLLQGIACLCCDSRRQVRSQALTYLQRALLVHDLQTLSAFEWESCFNKVLFPLLSKLLDTINAHDPSGIEETRMRASTLLCKVFLQHLTPLLSLSTFTALWLTILDFMDKYMHADRSDLLCEAIPESLKNMLLVMHTAGILHCGDTKESQLWKLTWDRIDTFLPNLRTEVFKPHELSETRRRSRGRDDTPLQQSEQQTVASNMTGDSSQQQQQQHPAPQQQQYYEQQYVQQAYQYVQQQHAAAAQQHTSSAVPVHGTAADNTDGAAESETRPDNYLTSTGAPGPSQYVLHPPLPATATSPSSDNATQHARTVPLLLNPDIIQSANIPIISPQSTPEKNREAATSS